MIDFTPRGQRIELVLHVANFNHRRGGVWKPIILGTTEKIHKLADQQIALDLLLVGAILMIATFNLAFFALRHDKFANPFLSLFCMITAIRIISVNERFIIRILPDLDWIVLTKIEYLSWYLIPPLFAHFLYEVFPKEVDRRVVYVLDGITLFALLIVLLTPLAIYSFTAPVMQVIHFTAVFWGAYCLLLARRHRRAGANLLLFGYLILLACTVNDILLTAWLVSTPSLVALGIVVFAVCQSILASYDFAITAKTLEKQYEQLATTSLKLKTQEKLRIEAELQSRNASTRFQESQQFEAMGMLAHGVVSDLKESFNEAATETELLAEALKSDPGLLALLEKTRENADHSVAVIEDLLSLSTFDNLEHSADTNAIIEAVIAEPKIQERATQQDVKLETQLSTAIQPVAGARIHVQRILQNLINNALDSQTSAGLTTVSSEQIYTDGRTLFYDSIVTGYYVVLSVEDSGTSYNVEDLDSIFQPFFSRSETSKRNMELGMSVVRAIVKQLHGGIDVISGEGQDTRFDIYLPISLPNSS